jgi:molybdopterin synthase sulfur carrier subunit
VQFNLYATFRLLAKTKTASLDLPEGTTVRQAVDALLEVHPVLRPHWVDQAGELHAHVHIFVNGHDLQTLDGGMETPLKPEDVLDFIPPVGGG